LGWLLYEGGAYAEAETMAEDAYFEAADGVAPEVVFDAAMWLVYVVGVSSARHADGQRWSRHAEVALASVRDGEHLRLGDLLGNLAVVHQLVGDYDEARALFERVLAIDERALSPDHPHLALSLSNLAIALYATEAHEEAKTLHERALAIREGTLGPDHPDVAASLTNLALLQETTGDDEGARTLYERALAINEKALGPDHPDVAYALMGLADVALAQRRPTDAVPLAQRAVAVLETNGVAAEDLADARFRLAQALWDAPEGKGRDRARAVTLAEQARDVFREAGTGRAEYLADVEKWLADHEGAP
jgi:tetratricopeptide (TPR) repeat protein